MSFLAGGLKGILNRRRARRARLPWGELEAEAARQRCSPADIFFDRAGLGDPNDVDEFLAAESAARATDADGRETGEPCARPAAWRGLDPRPAPRTG
ncbi:MAG: hypothetical protein ACRDK0_07560 [Solirubrobacteraceae bacterium]